MGLGIHCVFYSPVGTETISFGNDAAWNYRNSTPFLQPTYKLITVIAFICQYEFAIQIKRLQQSLCHTDIVSVPRFATRYEKKALYFRAVVCLACILGWLL